MIYNPQKYRIEDKKMEPFIDSEEIWDIINAAVPTKEQVREIIKNTLNSN